MSQAGIIDIEGSHPQIPTSFVTNSGTAIPILNVLEILGTTVAAHSIPLETTGSGNTVTVTAQYASAAASSVATNAGFASFNSTQFSVDANGFVALSGSAAGETITGNTGGALSPIAGNWNILGTSTAAGAIPVQTSGSGNTLTVQVQKAQAIASTNATNVGLAAFNSSQFTVDANGFVALNGSGVAETITGNAGGALSPTAGNWNILGASTAPGTTPVQTSGSVSTLTVQVQKSQAIASTNATNVGLAAFDSARFTVDANGFVSLNGAGVAETITGNVGGALSPTSGNWNILGTSTAAGTTPVQTSGSGSTLTVDVQMAQAIASTNASNIGLAAFNSAQFTVDANGFVSLNGSGSLETLTGNSGGAISPSSGNINTLGTGSITIVGSGNTLTTELTGLTAHAVLVGAGTATITKVGPTATSGQVLQSQGSTTDPAFSTATYPSTTTINQILYSSSANTVAGLSTADNGVLTTGTTGIPVITALSSDGQLIIGSSAGAPAAATITAGSGIAVTNGHNSITIAVASGSAVVETLTGNSGGAISPSSGNINTVGTGSITIAGSGSTLTTQLTGLTNHAVQVGAGTATLTQVGPTANTGAVLQNNSGADPSYSSASYPSSTTINQILYSSAANTVTGITAANSAVLVSTSTGVPQWSGTMTNGQLIIGSTSGTPTAATLTAGSGITITNGAGAITIAVTAGGTVVETLTGNSGGAISPSSGNINTLGTGSITIAGSGSTLTTQLTGLTNHAVLVGAGTATITNVGPTATSGQVLQSQGSTTDPAFSTATYPATTTINQILYSSSANVVAGLSTANNGVLTTGTGGVPVITALASDGQLIIGSSAGAPAAATITAGSGITVTNGHNSITISASSSGFSWTDVTTATQTIAAENGYITDRAGGVTYTLPASGSLGDTFKIVGKSGIATITPLANQQLLIGSASGTVGVTGTAVSTNTGDSITFVCITSGASTVWRAETFVGNWTLT